MPAGSMRSSSRSASSVIVHISTRLIAAEVASGSRCEVKRSLRTAGASTDSDSIDSPLLTSSGSRWAWKMAPALWPTACSVMSLPPGFEATSAASGSAKRNAPPASPSSASALDASSALSFMSPQAQAAARRAMNSNARSTASARIPRRCLMTSNALVSQTK